MGKYKRYQDYVIKDGEFVGEFEQMYKEFENPWFQSEEEFASEKAIAINTINALGARVVVEIGCGLGYFTESIRSCELVERAVGVDISETAILKAKQKFPKCEFYVSDVKNYNLFKEISPDIIILAEVTWYILEQLKDFLVFYKKSLPNTRMIHLLSVYPKGTQGYGQEFFTNLEEILNYFDLNYLEYGEICRTSNSGMKRTYFIGENK